jgi:hypothetical protein
VAALPPLRRPGRRPASTLDLRRLCRIDLVAPGAPVSAGTASGGMEPLDVAAAIADLLYDRPRPGTTAATRAAWYDRKAKVFGAIADFGGLDADQARAAANLARRVARRLREAANG